MEVCEYGLVGWVECVRRVCNLVDWKEGEKRNYIIHVKRTNTRESKRVSKSVSALFSNFIFDFQLHNGGMMVSTFVFFGRRIWTLQYYIQGRRQGNGGFEPLPVRNPASLSPPNEMTLCRLHWSMESCHFESRSVPSQHICCRTPLHFEILVTPQSYLQSMHV